MHRDTPTVAMQPAELWEGESQAQGTDTTKELSPWKLPCKGGSFAWDHLLAHWEADGVDNTVPALLL
jgi:hypothetical protein